MAVTELQLQVGPLRRSTIADTGDLQGLGIPFGHTGHEVRYQRALHAPKGPTALGIVGRRDRNHTVLDGIADVFDERQRQGSLGPLDGQHAVGDVGGHPCRDCHRLFTDAAHQNTSASTSPPTLAARASASESTPRGVETIEMPRPLRITGNSLEPE